MIVKVQFLESGEVKSVTSRHADHLIATNKAILFKEEKQDVATKENKVANKRQTKGKK